MTEAERQAIEAMLRFLEGDQRFKRGGWVSRIRMKELLATAEQVAVERLPAFRMV